MIHKIRNRFFLLTGFVIFDVMSSSHSYKIRKKVVDKNFLTKTMTKMYLLLHWHICNERLIRRGLNSFLINKIYQNLEPKFNSDFWSTFYSYSILLFSIIKKINIITGWDNGTTTKMAARALQWDNIWLWSCTRIRKIVYFLLNSYFLENSKIFKFSTIF